MSISAPIDGMESFHALRAIQGHVTIDTRLGEDGGELSTDMSSSFSFVNGLSMGGVTMDGHMGGI